jgi:hypothetical protein
LRQQARCWKEADDLRRFTDAVELGSEIAQWLDWATQQADRLDPLRPSPPSILEEKIEEVKNVSQATGDLGSRQAKSLDDLG